jgi:hypothetical protein
MLHCGSKIIQSVWKMIYGEFIALVDIEETLVNDKQVDLIFFQEEYKRYE